MNSNKDSFVKGFEKVSNGDAVASLRTNRKFPGISTKSIFKTRVGKMLKRIGK